MRAAVICAVFTLLFCVIPSAGAQEEPVTPPLLWFADQPDPEDAPIYGNFQIYAWDGSQVVNVSQYPGYCDGIYRFSVNLALFRCEGTLFMWDGQHTSAIAEAGRLLRPAFSIDGRLAAWMYTPDGEYKYEVTIWDGEQLTVVSQQYGWVGLPWWTVDGGEDTPRWSPDGKRLAWFSSQDDMRTIGIFVWDGEQVITVADGLSWVYRVQWTSSGDLLWVGDEAATGQRIRGIWDGQKNIPVGSFPEVATGRELLGPGDRIAWWAGEGNGVDVLVFNGQDTQIVSESPASRVDELSWLKNGQLIWVEDAGQDGLLYLWDGIRTSQILSEVGAVRSIIVSDAADEALITADLDGVRTFYIWTLAELIPLANSESTSSYASWTASGGVQLSLDSTTGRTLWYWDHTVLRLISDTPGLQAYSPVWNQNGSVVFDAAPEGQPSQIYLWENNQITPLLEGWILNAAQWRGNLLFFQASDNGSPYNSNSEIFLWDGTAVVNITQSPDYDGFYDPYGMG